MSSSRIEDNRQIAIDANSLLALRETALIGYWQGFPGIAAGFASRYIFFANYDFVYFANQMCFVNPERELSGRWRIIDDELELIITTRRVLVGGVEEPCPIFQVYWRGATLETFMLEEPEIIRLSLSCFTVDKNPYCDYQSRNHSIEIGGETFWKFDFFYDLFEMFRHVHW